MVTCVISRDGENAALAKNNDHEKIRERETRVAANRVSARKTKVHDRSLISKSAPTHRHKRRVDPADYCPRKIFRTHVSPNETCRSCGHRQDLFLRSTRSPCHPRRVRFSLSGKPFRE